jgi:hypothetical protein
VLTQNKWRIRFWGYLLICRYIMKTFYKVAYECQTRRDGTETKGAFAPWKWSKPRKIVSWAWRKSNGKQECPCVWRVCRNNTEASYEAVVQTNALRFQSQDSETSDVSTYWRRTVVWPHEDGVSNIMIIARAGWGTSRSTGQKWCSGRKTFRSAAEKGDSNTGKTEGRTYC